MKFELMDEGFQSEFDPLEIQNKFRNKSRKLIVQTLYREPFRYVDLLNLTGLKPGSIYHHLRILEGIVEKYDKGWYRLTLFGKQVAEKTGLVESSVIKPSVLNEQSDFEDGISILWLGRLNYILVAYTFITMIALSQSGVALSGSAIYAYESSYTILFDLLTFSIGWMALMLIEQVRRNPSTYGYFRYSLIIRLLSSLPGTILGSGLYLMFLEGRSIENGLFQLIFALTVISGFIFSATGIYYLRNESWKNSITNAALIAFIDLFFGLSILLTS